MNLQIGVKALIQNPKGEYLLIKRVDGLLDGSGIRWDIPGGRVMPDEPLEEALQREVADEVSLKLTGKPKLLAAQDIFIKDKQIHVVRLTYLSNSAGEIKLGREHQDYKWATKDEALDLTIDNPLRDLLGTLN